MPISINGSTGISGVNGSAATPAIQGGDSDTGIFFGTDTASIATAGTSRLHVDSSGQIGVNTTSPAALLQIVPTAVDTDIFAIRRQDSSTSNLFRFFQDSNISGGAGGAHINTLNRSLAITASSAGNPEDGIFLTTTGRVLVGTTVSRSISSNEYAIQVAGTDQGTGRIACIRATDGVGGAGIHLTKSRGTLETPAVVLEDDQIGIIAFNPYDGGDFARQCANIQVHMDGTPDEDDVPARLSMSLTPRGTVTPLPRFEIDSDGKALLTASSATRVKEVYGIRHPLEVKSSDNSSDPSGIFSNNGIMFYDVFMMGGADNDANAGIEFEIISSTSQHHPVQFFVMITGSNRHTVTPANIAAWRQYSFALYDEDVNGVRLTDSGGDTSSVSMTISNQGATDWTKGTASGLKLVTVKITGSTGRQETTMTVIASARLPIVRADRTSS